MRIFIFILTLISFAKVYSSDIKIGIFSKYSLSEISVETKEDARIFYAGKDTNLSKGIMTISLSEGNLLFSILGKKIQVEHLLIRTRDSFKVKARINNETVVRHYSGYLELFARDRKIQLVLTLPLEDYVSSAAISELGELGRNKKDLNNSLLAAQEIVIRTYIHNEKKRHFNDNYQFCDLTHCIHFAGITNNPPLTEDLILKGKNSVNGYFHSTCGGLLTGPEVFWSRHEISENYRKGNDGDIPNCKDSPHFNWETILTSSELEEALEISNLNSIKVILKDGRVKSILHSNFEGKENEISISVFYSKIGKAYGWNKIKSNYFQIKKKGSIYLFEGRGLGHGIGMCQWGAHSLAAKGKSYQEILSFYYPGTEIKRIH